MSYPYPANIVTICERLVDRIILGILGAPYRILSDGETMLLEDGVFYGDQERFPGAAAVCVEPADKDRTLQGVPNMTQNDFIIYILTYVQKVDQSVQDTRKDVDNLAYDIEHWLHQDLQLKDPLTSAPALIHGFVQRSESGLAVKNNTLYRASRMTFFGRNKTSLPVA